MAFWKYRHLGRISDCIIVADCYITIFAELIKIKLIIKLIIVM